MSRQRQWQIRQNERGLCVVCTAPALMSGQCPKHYAERAVSTRNKMRAKRGIPPSNAPVMFRDKTLQRLRALGIMAVGITPDGTLVSATAMRQMLESLMGSRQRDKKSQAK